MAATTDKKNNGLPGPTLVGTKVGMTRIFDAGGKNVPVTVIEVHPNVVTQLRTAETDGYTAVQVGAGEIKARNSTIPVLGHDAKAGTSPKRWHREFRVSADELGGYALGQELTLDALKHCLFVDVTGTSKGKGFAGGMKRHGFKGMPASHGTERKHRSPGSIGGHGTNRGWCGKINKGKKMAGHMGAERVTIRSIPVVRIDAEKNLILVQGAIPGPTRGMVAVKPAVRLYRGKAKKQAEAKAG
jgi:large subunit ribosomal protein L3